MWGLMYSSDKDTESFKAIKERAEVLSEGG